MVDTQRPKDPNENIDYKMGPPYPKVEGGHSLADHIITIPIIIGFAGLAIAAAGLALGYLQLAAIAPFAYPVFGTVVGGALAIGFGLGALKKESEFKHSGTVVHTEKIKPHVRAIKLAIAVAFAVYAAVSAVTLIRKGEGPHRVPGIPYVENVQKARPRADAKSQVAQAEKRGNAEGRNLEFAARWANMKQERVRTAIINKQVRLPALSRS